jgi:hypothetical protein
MQNSSPVESQPIRDWRSARAWNPWLFPSPIELIGDKSEIGEVFRQLPEHLLRDASEEPDPWEALKSHPLVQTRDTEGRYQQVFTACGSVLRAAQQLSPYAWCGRPVHIHKVTERLKAAPGPTPDAPDVRELFGTVYRQDSLGLREWIATAPPDVQETFRQLEADFEQRRAKEEGKSPALETRWDRRQAGDRLRQEHPVEYLLLHGWLRCGPFGDPGLCFYSDAALAALLELLDWQGFQVKSDGLNRENLRATRRRIGLKQAFVTKPLVTDARMDVDGKTIWLYEDDARLLKEGGHTKQVFRCGAQLLTRDLLHPRG